VISPPQSNIYLDPLDHLMVRQGFEMVRYADDFVVLCRSEAQAARALAVVADWTAAAGLILHPDKTQLIDARVQGFDFLGYRFEGGRRWPRDKNLAKFKDSIRAKTRRTAGQSLRAIIDELNPILRGGVGSPTSNIATARRSLTSTAGRAAGCEACCVAIKASEASLGVPIISAGPTTSLPSRGSSACSEPVPWPVSPPVGKTTNWRAGCGRSARPVRSEGEAGTPLPASVDDGRFIDEGLPSAGVARSRQRP
jgi:hypothetical protein